jgi:hypothetical protein
MVEVDGVMRCQMTQVSDKIFTFSSGFCSDPDRVFVDLFLNFANLLLR